MNCHDPEDFLMRHHVESPAVSDPAEIPPDVARKILAARDALIKGDVDAAYHALYAIANPGFDSYDPWNALENRSALA